MKLTATNVVSHPLSCDKVQMVASQVAQRLDNVPRGSGREEVTDHDARITFHELGGIQLDVWEPVSGYTIGK
jgi:hypothetical protein